jgi:hypothetical protein
MGNAVPSTDWWLGLIAVCTGIVALLAAIKGVAMVIKALWHAIGRMEQVADLLLGDKVKGIPPMQERLAALEAAKHTHPEPHGHNGPTARGRVRG